MGKSKDVKDDPFTMGMGVYLHMCQWHYRKNEGKKQCHGSDLVMPKGRNATT